MHQCEALADMYEARVNRFGYSLRNLTAVLPGPLLDQFRLSL